MAALDGLTGISALWAAVFLREDNALGVISILLVTLSVLGAFETPTVQACIPQMLTGDNIIKGNAVVNQAASISYLIAPMAGGVLYGVIGLKPVMYASVVCFFITALFECFIKLGPGGEAQEMGQKQGNILSVIKYDFRASIRFMARERTDIMKMLFLTAMTRFFVMGVTLVGIPFLVRTVLGLEAAYYGGAESALAVATILGSIGAGLLTGKLHMGTLSHVLAAIGACILLVGAAFLFETDTMVKYSVMVAAFGGMQAAISVFSIFAVSVIQQSTPNHLIGKVMAYTSAITMCTQPLGQMVYGVLFDRFRDAVYVVLIPTGVIVWAAGVLLAGFFRRLSGGPDQA